MELDPDNNLRDRLMVIILAFVGVPGITALFMYLLLKALPLS